VSLIVFEDELVENFYPLTLTRASFELLLGTGTLLESLLQRFKTSSISVFSRNYLEPVIKKRIRKQNVSRFDADEDMLLVNGFVDSSSIDFGKLARREGRFIAFSGGNIVLARLPGRVLAKLNRNGKFPFLDVARIKEYERLEAGESTLYRYPWEFVDNNADAITVQAKGLSLEQTGNGGVFVTGPRNRVFVASDAEFEAPVAIDTRKGPVMIAEGAEIQAMSRLVGPCYIGKGTKVRSAIIGEGTSIGGICVVGGEIEHSIISDHTNKAHLGYLGHSIVGSWVNLGAQSTNSNLKNTYGKIKVRVNDGQINTSRTKVGCYIADNVKTAIGSLILSGKRIGVGSHVYGLVAEDVPSFTIYAKSLSKKSCELELDSAIETQRRMMDRRGVKQTKDDIELLKHIFQSTRAERKSMGIIRGKFKI
jgi:UDP-N-acetylglucosamine diphosphorylase/glucosamine-1-phosphate N-acetyltransferase